MKNFTINHFLITIIALFSGANAVAAEPVCNQFDYFYADITTPSGVKQTDIYTVSFVGSNAILNALTEDIPYGAHIAYNPIGRLLYVVNEDDGSVQTYDPILNVWGTVIAPDMNLNHITSASISPDGKLLLGNQDDGVIYIANFSTDPYTVTVYEPDNNISGGDLVFTDTGLFLASKPSGYFYMVLPGMPNVLLGQVDGNVTGLAKAEDGETVMLSANGNTSFLQYDISTGVNQIHEYNAVLNGEPFTLNNGDMASGCSSTELIVNGCTDFRYYYIAMGTPGAPGIEIGTVFQGEIVGSDFVLTELFKTGSKGHIANNEINGDIYIVNGIGTTIKTFDLNGNLLHTAPISGLGSAATALVWHKADGKVYVGNRVEQKVYTIDPVTGNRVLFASNMPVGGGDLLSTDNGELHLIKRFDNGASKVYDITTGTAVFLYGAAKSINGAAKTPSGGSIMSEGNNSFNFHEYDADGLPLGILNSVDSDGNPLPLIDGDMASGCLKYGPVVEEECNSYSLFYTDFKNQSKSEIYRLDLNDDNTLNKMLIATLNFGSVSLAASDDNKLYLFSRFGDGYYVVLDAINGNQIGGNIPMTDESNNNIQEVGGSVFHNGLLYVSSLDGMIYALNPATGHAVETITSVAGKVSDILFDENDDLWAIHRPTGTFHNLTANTSFTVPLIDIDGIALLPNGNFAAANGDFDSLFFEIDPTAGELTGVSFETGITMQWGDLSGICFKNQDQVEPLCDSYSMFYTDFKNQSKSEIYRLDLINNNMLSKSHLATLNFGSVTSAVSHDGNLYIFSRFGNGYFVVLDAVTGNQIGGNIPMTDESNNNIQEVGGSVFHNGLVYVSSLDGMIYALNPATGQAIETITSVAGKVSDILFDENDDLWAIHRPTGTFYNLTANTSFTIPLIEIDGIALLPNGNFAAANGDFNSLIFEINPIVGELTGVSFQTGIKMQWGDLSGICFDPIEEDDETPPTNPFVALQSHAVITTYPNPTKGSSKVVFTVGATTRTLVEVYDMNGRNVATLFNQEAQKGKEYAVDFNGNMLPNGVYVVRFNDGENVVFNKIMIAR